MNARTYQYRSVLDPLLTWQDSAALDAWNKEHPGDARGHVIIIEELPE